VANLAANLYVSPFSVNFNLLGSSSKISSQLLLKVAFTNSSSYDNGNMYGLRTERLCYLAPATVQYPIRLSGTIVEIVENDDFANPSPNAIGGGRLQTKSFQSPPIDGTDMAGSDYERWTLGKNH
jgi:hypothetical protein